MPPFQYITTDIRDIDLICPLWIQLNEYMCTRATTFRSHFKQMTFDKRKAYFAKVAAGGSLRLDLAYADQDNGRHIGYCVSSLSAEKTGEIESIFVKDPYRSCGIGSALITKALAWLDENGSVRNRVSASDGNEGVWDFYKKFGFYPRLTVLEQKRDQ
jgi:GNAT superfamily N-acetyltransferase